MLYGLENKNPPKFAIKSIISKYNLEKKIDLYFNEIMEYNRKVNIVSRETSYDDLLAIAADSLVPFEFLPPPAGEIFDIGPGAGFPSVVVLIAFPNLRGTLIERTKKKTVFLRKIAGRLNLKVKILDSNFVDVRPKLAATSFDFGFMKLVRPDTRLLRTALDILRPGGIFIYFSDISTASIKIPEKIEIKIYNYFLDKSNRLRTITVFSKTL